MRNTGVVSQFSYMAIGDCGHNATCIVPVSWMEKSLPALGNCVVYTDNVQKDALRGLIFQFIEPEFEDASNTIYLQMYSQNEVANTTSLEISNYFNAPVKIHFRSLDGRGEASNLCAEGVLLNHLLAPWNTPGIIGFDQADIVHALGMHSEFILEFGMGKTPKDIVPSILKRVACRDVDVAILVVSGDSNHSWLTHINEMMELFEGEYDDALLIVGHVPMIQDKIMISALVGCWSNACSKT